MRIENNGGRDFWGNPLYTGAPDIGAFEDPNSTIDDTEPPAKPTGLAATSKTDTTITLEWNAAENGVPLDGLVYDAASGEKIAEVMMANSIVLTGLAPDTEYTFYIVARDLAGNESEPSDPLTVRTAIPAVIVDNADAVLNGAWTIAAGEGSYGGDFAKAPKGDGSATAEWTPVLVKDGYYAVYVHLPKGLYTRAAHAPFIVNFDGGSKTYYVNEQTASGGEWVLLGVHKFKAGTAGSVLATNEADGEVAADAVKFQYVDDISPDSIASVVLTAPKMQLKIGEQMTLTFLGTNASGYGLDLVSEGFEVTFTALGDEISVTEDGIVTGLFQGRAKISASVVINGIAYTSNMIEVIVGPGFIVDGPDIADTNGNPLSSLPPGGLVNVSVRAFNSTDDLRSVTLIAAYYNRKGLVQSGTKRATIGSYENEALSVSLALPEDIDDGYVKIFVWDHLDALHPLIESTRFPDEA